MVQFRHSQHLPILAMHRIQLKKVQRPTGKAFTTRPIKHALSKANAIHGIFQQFPSLIQWRFQILLTLFSKSFSYFPRGTCMLSVFWTYLALEGIYLPFRLHSQAIRLSENSPYEANSKPTTGLSPCFALLSSKLQPGPHSGHVSTSHISSWMNQEDYRLELLSVHSPLLRESFLVSIPPLIYMLKFRG